MALRIDRTTMVALLDDLEAKGYVARQRHPHDRRAFLVHRTDSGRLAKVDAVRILDEQQRQFLEPLTIAVHELSCSQNNQAAPKEQTWLTAGSRSLNWTGFPTISASGSA
jgi:DNA-binding PadR family transcriptional regulator